MIPDLIVDAIPPYTFANPYEYSNISTHGYDPKLVKSLEAIFIANGPGFKSGETIEPFENVYIYSIISRLLGIETTSDINRSPRIEAALLR